MWVYYLYCQDWDFSWRTNSSHFSPDPQHWLCTCLGLESRVLGHNLGPMVQDQNTLEELIDVICHVGISTFRLRIDQGLQWICFLLFAYEDLQLLLCFHNFGGHIVLDFAPCYGSSWLWASWKLYLQQTRLKVGMSPDFQALNFCNFQLPIVIVL